MKNQNISLVNAKWRRAGCSIFSATDITLCLDTSGSMYRFYP